MCNWSILLRFKRQGPSYPEGSGARSFFGTARAPIYSLRRRGAGLSLPRWAATITLQRHGHRLCCWARSGGIVGMGRNRRIIPRASAMLGSMVAIPEYQAIARHLLMRAWQGQLYILTRTAGA